MQAESPHIYLVMFYVAFSIRWHHKNHLKLFWIQRLCENLLKFVLLFTSFTNKRHQLLPFHLSVIAQCPAYPKQLSGLRVTLLDVTPLVFLIETHVQTHFFDHLNLHTTARYILEGKFEAPIRECRFYAGSMLLGGYQKKKKSALFICSQARYFF